MSKKTKKIKKLKKSQIIFNTLNNKEKIVARVLKEFFQGYKPSKLKENFDLDMEIDKIFSIDNLSTWSLNREIDAINKHIKFNELTEFTNVEVVLRIATYLYLLSKTPYDNRVKFIKDIEKWEDTIILSSIHMIMKFSNNHITQYEVDSLIYNSESILLQDYYKQMNREMPEVVLHYTNIVLDHIQNTLNDTMHKLYNSPDLPSMDRLWDFAEACMIESINVKAIKEFYRQRYIELYTEEVVYVIDEMTQMLLNEVYKVIDLMNIEELREEYSNAIIFSSMSWRNLEKEAIKKGYQYMRSNGDHGIYKNENGKLIVIPRGRTIGKGLQLQILKQIEEMD